MEFAYQNYTVEYGNNGWKLEFLQTGTGTSSSTIGGDTSGNDNHWTSNNQIAQRILVSRFTQKIIFGIVESSCITYCNHCNLTQGNFTLEQSLRVVLFTSHFSPTKCQMVLGEVHIDSSKVEVPFTMMVQRYKFRVDEYATSKRNIFMFMM